MKIIITESQLKLILEGDEEDINKIIEKVRSEQSVYWYNRVKSLENTRKFKKNLAQETKNYIDNTIEFIILETTEAFNKKTKEMGQPTSKELVVGRAIEPKTVLINLETIKKIGMQILPNTLEHELNHLVSGFVQWYGIKNRMQKPKIGLPGLFGRLLSQEELYVLNREENSARMNQLRKMLSIPVETTPAQMMEIMMNAFTQKKIKLKNGIIFEKGTDGTTIIFKKENPSEPTKNKFNLLQLWQVYTYEIIESWGNGYEPSDLGALLANASEKSGNEIHLDIKFLSGYNNSLAKNSASTRFSDFG